MIFQANNITLTIGQAFDVAYEEYMKVKKVEETRLDNKVCSFGFANF